MQTQDVRSATEAAKASASALGLPADAAVVLQDSNRLTLRLLPCDVVARVAPIGKRAGAEFEVEVARRLAGTGAPVAVLEPRMVPRVYERDGFAITFWTHYEPGSQNEISPAEYADALERLHAGMRAIDLPAPHFTDRVAEAQALVGSPALTPELPEADRELLAHALQDLRRALGERGPAEQLLHGEPHPGNLLRTKQGLLFIDLETCCRGPIEFDVAHAPGEVGEHYPEIDRELLAKCRTLTLAMVAAWRWDRDDKFPGGREMGTAFLSQLREALEWDGLGAPS